MADLYTAQQMRMLHGLAKRRGLDHDDLRRIAGVESLTDLSGSAMAGLLTRLSDDRPGTCGTGLRPVKRRLPRLAPGVMRPATDRQRAKLSYLLADTGWPAATIAHWLWSRYLVRDVRTTPMSTTTAHQIITALEQVLSKSVRSAP